MKFALLALVASTIALSTPTQWYPLTRKGEIPTIEPYAFGQDVFIDCISRNIDNGEHKFDSNDRIVYSAFPKCKETGKPLGFRYGVLEDVNCTIGFSDELYHLFQLYIHEDSPFSCRIPLSTEANYLELGGAYIPLTFNIRGEIHDSHLDIDNHLNLVLTKPSNAIAEQQTVISAVAWSAGTNATRVIIGDYLTLQIAVRWMDNLSNSGSQAANTVGLPYPDGFYKLPLNSIPMNYTQLIVTLVLVALVVGVVSSTISYKLKGRKGYVSLDRESSISKQD